MEKIFFLLSLALCASASAKTSSNDSSEILKRIESIEMRLDSLQQKVDPCIGFSYDGFVLAETPIYKPNSHVLGSLSKSDRIWGGMWRFKFIKEVNKDIYDYDEENNRWTIVKEGTKVYLIETYTSECKPFKRNPSYVLPEQLELI